MYFENQFFLARNLLCHGFGEQGSCVHLVIAKKATGLKERDLKFPEPRYQILNPYPLMLEKW